MLYFKAIVYPARIEIIEYEHLGVYHHKAIVGRQEWLYKIEKSKKQPPQDKGWFERASPTIFWHAANSGYCVKWVEVHKVKKARKRKVHANQIEMF